MKTDKRTILVIDDVEENRLILQRRLEAEGFVVTSARNGKEGLETMEQQRPNMILLDLNMPVMDGHTFLKTIKADNRYAKIPVIIITALDETGAVIKTMRAGACGYLTKPFNMDQIRAQLDFCIRGETPPVQP
jgi:two-component system cell cycle response regulator